MQFCLDFAKSRSYVHTLGRFLAVQNWTPVQRIEAIENIGTLPLSPHPRNQSTEMIVGAILLKYHESDRPAARRGIIAAAREIQGLTTEPQCE